MLTLMVLLLPLLNLVFPCCGYPLLHINLSPSVLSSQPPSTKRILQDHVREDPYDKSVSISFFRLRPFSHLPALMPSIRGKSMPSKPAFAPSNPPQPSLGPSPAPSPYPINQGFASPTSSPISKTRHHHHHHRKRIPAVSPTPSVVSGCDQITCSEPLTSTPIGSPCGCVVPMQVELHLGVASYAVFHLIGELEIEVAEGTYLKQSQVRIMGANADNQDQGTVVDINLVPLGEKFDNTTATLTYERFLNKKVPINATLFGDYELISIKYPGLPSSLPFGNNTGNGPSGSIGGHENPIMANFHGKNQRMNGRIIAIIALSAFVLFLVCVLGMFILLKCKKFTRPSTAVGPTIASSITKRSGIRSFLSNSMASSASVSLVSTMGPCILSVKTFTLAELEKATEKFSSKKILGEGGFGRVYHGIMEDGTEVAVKLLIRDDQNGDREFISEVEMLSRLHHRNLVKLIGICIEEHIRCLVYELVHNGSLESHLHGADKKKGVLDWDARMKIALGAARGLAYLHEDSNPRVIHRDFKASNVLLEDDFTPKVSDFGLAREATEGSNHISTRVMGTFGYVAPEYAMTGHLLVKSDVYSYGVVLLELLSGRKPVDMSQPQGQENLVTWARPLLTNQEGLEKLVDPSLAGSYNFDDMAKVAAIASMCVHPEVAQRPFMGEVVQALKLIYNDMDETCGDCCSQKEPSDTDCDLKGDFGPSDSSWWNAGGISPRLTYGCASSFITMEYCSGPLDDIDNNRPHSASSFIGGGEGSLPIRHANRSGPLRTVRSKPAFYRLRGSMSEHGGFIPRRVWGDRYWV
ncbi:PREDICTED: receptor-like serine/threonine-protein kinase ALE2 isoform X2 [Nelumbo nucifera]|uniref:Receptor-like serine/threonine-protein kinase ALE2 isoform X2 n=1 Tax=Nelumbo nucifera TaxID=4432 RepID=A0A1U8AN97_NELNU|nr:PREDICTED: receptor-like serine/threonine-protein kinase ALE2 isoform X2 [Nelumbo nucifera]